MLHYLACRGFAFGVLSRFFLFLRDVELVSRGVVVEQAGVAAPVNGGVQLLDGFVFAEVFVEGVVEEFVGQSMVRLRSQASA